MAAAKWFKPGTPAASSLHLCQVLERSIMSPAAKFFSLGPFGRGDAGGMVGSKNFS